jgi:hypothetical protein
VSAQTYTGAFAEGFWQKLNAGVFQRPHKHRECALPSHLTVGLAVSQFKPLDRRDPNSGRIGQLALRHPDKRTCVAELTGLKHKGLALVLSRREAHSARQIEIIMREIRLTNPQQRRNSACHIYYWK